MYKSKLQELCQRRSWELPEYTTVKDGPGHMPRFTAVVNVHGQAFETPWHCKSSKEAQNAAAQIAFEQLNAPPPPAGDSLPASTPPPATVTSSVYAVCHDPPVPIAPPVAPPPEIQPVAAVSSVLPLSPLPSFLPNPPPGLLAVKNDAKTTPANEEVLQENCEDTHTSLVDTIAIDSHDKPRKDMLHVYKNQLQQYAQKENLGFPVYTSEAQGLPHARRFKAKVSIGGKSYETSEFFSTLKEAEQASAKVACQMLSVDIIQEDGGLYKNLLQGFAQKKGLLCPSYETVTSGQSHRPIFVSTVEVGTEFFRGAEAKTKRQAEMNAAKVAYSALTEGSAATKSSKVSSISECPVADNLSENFEPIAIIKKHQGTTEDEAHLHAKRAKSSPENMNVDSSLLHPSVSNPPSNGSDLLNFQVENSTSAKPATKQTVEIHPSLRWKTVVVPRNSSLPIPECASVMPYSDNQWVAYKVGLDQEPTA